MKKFGDELKRKVQTKFEEFALFSTKDTKIEVSALPDNFYAQIRNHLSIQWVALPYKDENYKEQFKEIESLLGAVKNVREFEQLEETGRKCSLCGERNVLFFNGSKHTYIQSDAIKVHTLQLQKGEGLCAVCFAKRFYQSVEFPSTAEIALKDIFTKLINNRFCNNIIKEYKSNLGNDFDYQLLFEDNLTEKYFERQNISKDLLKSAKEIFPKLKKTIKNENLSYLKFTPYYAILMFDGDSMGKWLSGANLKPKANLLEFHKKLTWLLGDFAADTEKIVSDEKGKVVYAGGEDFLAFINLNHLFEVVKSLRLKFDEIVNQGISEFKLIEKNLTFSAGIIIAHYKMPLSEVLNWARKLEKIAKNIDDDKNAFAIAVMKHSGEINQAVLKWGEKKAEKLDVITQVTKDLAGDVFSKSYIDKFSTEFTGLNLRTEILETELTRLLVRSSKIQKMDLESKEDFIIRKKQKIKKTVKDILTLNEKLNTENLFSALYISEFISRHLNGGKNEN
jgi:CRISPR-associated protein Cmr2